MQSGHFPTFFAWKGSTSQTQLEEAPKQSIPQEPVNLWSSHTQNQ